MVEGPDGKIYWDISNIRASIEDLEGFKYPHPNCGVLCRSNPALPLSLQLLLNLED